MLVRHGDDLYAAARPGVNQPAAPCIRPGAGFHAHDHGRSNAAAATRARSESSLVSTETTNMNHSFGIDYQSPSRVWEVIRKGPPLDAVREHLDRVVNFGLYCEMARDRERMPRR